MDGTLLDSSSRVLPSSVEALRAAIDAGVTVQLPARPECPNLAFLRTVSAAAAPRMSCVLCVSSQVCLATGKARPAAIAAMDTVGLSGEPTGGQTDV
jgi:hypothetical protein